MKKLSLTISICVFFLICSNRIQAQATQTKLNQIELVKQFLGTWKNETKKDTTTIVEITCFRNGALELNYKNFTKEKVLSERKTLWGYDKESDKFILGSIWDNSWNMNLNVLYFTTQSMCDYLPFKYISNPEQAPSKTVYVFKSPDLFTATSYNKNTPVGPVITYNRVK